MTLGGKREPPCRCRGDIVNDTGNKRRRPGTNAFLECPERLSRIDGLGDHYLVPLQADRFETVNIGKPVFGAHGTGKTPENTRTLPLDKTALTGRCSHPARSLHCLLVACDAARDQRREKTESAVRSRSPISVHSLIPNLTALCFPSRLDLMHPICLELNCLKGQKETRTGMGQRDRPGERTRQRL